MPQWLKGAMTAKTPLTLTTPQGNSPPNDTQNSQTAPNYFTVSGPSIAMVGCGNL